MTLQKSGQDPLIAKYHKFFEIMKNENSPLFETFSN